MIPTYIWANSAVAERFQNGDFGNSFLLGDSGYPQTAYIMTPFRNPIGRGQQRYNTAQMTGRCTVERALGVAKMRFRCLHKSSGYLGYVPGRCARIIGTCLILHNICRRGNIALPDNDDGASDDDDDGNDEDDDDDDDDDTHHNGGNVPDGVNLRNQLVLQRFP